MMIAVVMGIMMVGMMVVVVLIAAASLVAVKSRVSPVFDPFDEKPKRGRIVVNDDGEWAFEEKTKRQ